MRIVFVPGGGFNKSGAFAELGDDERIREDTKLYERQSYLSPLIRCTEMLFSWHLNAATETKKADDSTKKGLMPDPFALAPKRRLSATGRIEPSRWGVHRLSCLGEGRLHDTMVVNVHDGGAHELVRCGGYGEMNDVDLYVEETFYVEVHLPTVKFDELVREISKDGAELLIRIRLSAFSGFYSTWSPAIDDGRVIKYLEDRRDVENGDEIPEEFWNQGYHDEAQGNRDRPPVELTVSRRVAPITTVIDDADIEREPVRLPSATDAALLTQLGKIDTTLKTIVFGLIAFAAAVFYSNK